MGIQARVARVGFPVRLVGKSSRVQQHPHHSESNRMKINKSWWPAPYEDRRAWLVSFKASIATMGAAVGMTAGEISQFNSYCDAAINAIDNAVARENLYNSALADRQTLTNTLMDFLRPIVRRIKTSATYTTTIGEALDIIGESVVIDPATVKPSLTVLVQPLGVRARIKRNGAESVNLYMRRTGQPNWNLVCRVERSTCEDTTPLLNDALPEVREYRVIAVMNDVEVGIPSDPKQVIFAGSLAA